MGQVRHGCATTTHAVRAAIQRSQASLATLSRELGINPKTVAKWRKRATVEDLKTGPKAPHSTTLSQAEEAMVVAFRRHTLLPLDDCPYALQPWIPQSNGMAEAFVRTLKRDYVRVNPTPDAQTVIEQLPRWLAHYNEVHPHCPFGYRSPREYIAQTHKAPSGL